MTPEERVDALWRKWQTTPLTSLKALMAEELAAAITAAVKEERAACAAVAAQPMTFGGERAYIDGARDAQELIAAAIRERTP